MNANNWLLAAKTSSWNKELSGEEGLHLHFTQNVVTFEYLKCRQRQNLLAVNSKTDVRLALDQLYIARNTLKYRYHTRVYNSTATKTLPSIQLPHLQENFLLLVVYQSKIHLLPFAFSLLPRRVFYALEKYSV